MSLVTPLVRRFGAVPVAVTLAAVLGIAAGGVASAAAHHREDGPAYRDASLPTTTRVADLLGRMTLAEKIGQMTQAERVDVSDDPSVITTNLLGSVLSGGGSVPDNDSAAGWADMIDTLQAAALKTRLGIPLLYGIDAVHGQATTSDATVFPHNIGLGATRDPALVEKIGHATALETRASGISWTFAPCLCVARDDRWGRTYESFGEEPALVESMETVIDGLQGEPGRLDQPDRILATAKHFGGDGLADYDETKAGTDTYPIDQGIARVSQADFARLVEDVFDRAIKTHHVGSIMPSYSSLELTDAPTDGGDEPVKSHANGELLTDWLKRQEGFDGFVVSDWRAIRQLPGPYADQVRTALLAGVDMFMEPIQAPNNPTGWDEFIATLTTLVTDGEVPVARIDDAVSRILTAKFELGLFEHPMADRSLADQVGSPEHHALARTAAAESQVLLKNDAHTLPLAGTRPIYVAGSNADHIGNQAGGWTVTWQGGSANEITGTTILDGIKAHAADSGAPLTFSEDAAAPVPAGADGVVVVGETPYAEGYGDVGGPRWSFDPADHGNPRPAQTMQLSAADRKAVETVCAEAATCTVLVVSGRPMILPPDLLGQIDALVASWLPGSEGSGVADVLFGTVPFTGKLPVSWPRTLAQEPINVGDVDYDPLFAYGFGLTD